MWTRWQATSFGFSRLNDSDHPNQPPQLQPDTPTKSPLDPEEAQSKKKKLHALIHMLPINPNHEFLDHFNEYIYKDWASNYLAYDILKKEYHRIKHMSDSSKRYEDKLLAEIKRVHYFMLDNLEEAEDDLTVISGTIEALQITVSSGSEKLLKDAILSQSQKIASSRELSAVFPDKMQKHPSLKQRKHNHKTPTHNFHPKHHPIEFIAHSMESLIRIAQKVETIVLDEEHASRKAKQLDHNIELAIRSIYAILCRLEKFHKLNSYVICKVGKRLEKLYHKQQHHHHHHKSPKKLSTSSAVSSRLQYAFSADASPIEGDTPSKKLQKAAVSPLHIPKEAKEAMLMMEEVEEEEEDEGEEVDEDDEESSDNEDDDYVEDIEAGCKCCVEDSSTLFSSETDNMANIVATTSKTSGMQSQKPQASSSLSTPKRQVQLKTTWRESISGYYYYRDFVSTGQRIKDLKQRCIDLYSLKFKKAQSELAAFELEFVENKDHNSRYTVPWISFKAGLMVCMITWIVADSLSAERDLLNFWQQPSIYVYTTIFNLLLYRLFWAIDIAVWVRFGVNYISILELANIKPNLLFVINQTTSLMLLYFLSLLIFYRANASKETLDNSFVSYGSPLILLLSSIAIQVVQTFIYHQKHDSSRGLFNRRVVMSMLSAPLVPLTFRDAYGADVLTSFNKVIADTLYAFCWVGSSSFIQKLPSEDETHVLQQSSHFGSDYWQCKGPQMVLAVSILQLIPLITRLLQCLRGIYESNGKLFPFAFNAWKYLLSIFVVFFSIKGYQIDNQVYLFLVIMTTLYKWWWDVAMDWGLLDTMPCSWKEFCQLSMFAHRKYLLRTSLMYPHPGIYYFCIVLNLFLRFIWVLSLAPTSYLGGMVGGKLSLLMGSLEIIRRSIWGIFRLEWEHVKLLKNATPGFLPSHILRAHEWSHKYGAASVSLSSGNQSTNVSSKSSKKSSLEGEEGEDSSNGKGRRQSMWQQAVDELQSSDKTAQFSPLTMELPARQETYDEYDFK